MNNNIIMNMFIFIFLYFYIIEKNKNIDIDVDDKIINTWSVSIWEIINSQSWEIEEEKDIETNVWDYFSYIWWDFINIKDWFWEFIWEEQLKEINEYVNNDDYIYIQKISTEIIEEIENKEELTQRDKININVLNYLKINWILNEWTYTNTEEEKSEIAIKIIKELWQKYPKLKDNFLSNYYLWYANEIIKNYTWALVYYNEWLNYLERNEQNKDKIKQESILKNQIWHVYDLKWETDIAYSYYYDAYNTYQYNYKSSINIARYLVRKWDLETARTFFQYSLNASSNLLRSEILFSLSSIELELNWLTPDIDKSIEYAKKSVEFNPNYWLWYLAIARWYYMKNDTNYDDIIKENLNKSIELNKNWNEAYRYYALYYLDKWDIEKIKEYILKSHEVIPKDMVLMDDQRVFFHYLNDILELYSWISIENIETIYDFYEEERLSYFILTQLKRSNHWIYNKINDKEQFNSVISYFNN